MVNERFVVWRETDYSSIHLATVLCVQMVLTTALIQSIARHVQTSPSISPLHIDTSAHRLLSPHQSQQNMSHSACPLFPSSRPSTVRNPPNILCASTGCDPIARGDMHTASQSPISPSNLSSHVNARELLIARPPEDHASIIPSPSLSQSVLSDSLFSFSDLMSVSDSTSLSSTALPQSMTSDVPSTRHSVVNDLPPRPHSAYARNEPEAELLNLLRGVPRPSQSQQPVGSREATDVTSDDDNDDGTHLIIIGYETNQHEVPRPVSEPRSLTQ